MLFVGVEGWGTAFESDVVAAAAVALGEACRRLGL